MTKLAKYLEESSLSKIFRHNEQHDCGALTAFRKGSNCGIGTPYTLKEKKQRNKSLEIKLLSMDYSITSVKGIYPEGGKTQKENGFFVVDLYDNGKLEKNIRDLGEYFDQDSILFIPKGSVVQKDKAYLIGTNNCTNNKLGYGKIELFNKGRFGYTSKIYTTYVNGRPFIFEDSGIICPCPGSGFGMWAMRSISKHEWFEMDVD